ncbi:SsgA family sporulation/cell division regulator [Streptomyces sp. NPDC001212]|uniref:SsgA family sporulation/cell division regulator n=1 Tax=unclassified Streptomyces TaxID=2593676 RepID=UPI00248178AE|nr:SsgA family sporulation/cell division regulator [Streptomyces sp. HYC2]
MHYHIDQTLHMELVLPSGDRLAVPTRLYYATQDPFAAIIVFQTGTVHQVSWALARDTLTEGLNRPTGQGNVRVWPVGSGADAELNLALSSPHGTAWLTAPLPVVAQWLGRTYHLVPAGQEVSGLDMDAELSRLLDGAA